MKDLWREEWKGTADGRPYFVVFERGRAGGWRWTLRFDRRRNGPVGGAPTIAAARKAVRFWLTGPGAM